MLGRPGHAHEYRSPEVVDGLEWVASDHALCRDELKAGNPRDNAFVAKSGFGGTEYLLAGR